ncbi:type II toxin-antitoxin system RatA family toxin [Rhodopila globiformis]|nr:type II toxin-antitoxin system RatA family toxin [Rhodopila globiformis]
MRTIAIHRTIGHDWTEMFALVLDIERYPQFVPGCTHERILARREIRPGCSEIISRMTVGMAPLQFSYTNRTLGDQEARRITVDSTDGPLRDLQVTWQFNPLGPARTRIDFSAKYEFHNPIVARLAAGAFDSLFRRIIDAFERRARLRVPLSRTLSLAGASPLS